MMKANKVSNAQLAVWEWKEKAYQTVADLPEKDQIPFIRRKVRDKIFIIKQLQLRKKEQINE
jgi:hypothetical protein